MPRSRSCRPTTSSPSSAATARSSSSPPDPRPVMEATGIGFRPDPLTWIAYALLAWFAYLQAAPGLVIVHLREELHLSYSAGGLHVAAFATGAMVAGFACAPLERALGRRALFWSAAALMGAGAVGLT